MQHLQPPIIPPQVLRLAIAKFSHTTTAIDHVGPLTWNHVPGNGDLACIFEKFLDSGSVPSRMIQKVVRGDGILEQLDLVFFTRMAGMQARLIPPPRSHFAVVVKSPCLAIKYPHGETHIRRFQIKFTTERDYFMALTLLGEINCPLTEGKIPVPAIQRLPSVSSWTSGHLSSIAPRTANTAATSTSSNGVHFYPTGALGSGRTTPIRASSPASTISHPVSRLGPVPALNLPSQSMGPVDLSQPLHASALAHISNQEPEPRSSQLSTISAIHDVDQLNQMLPPKRDLPFSKPTARKPHAASLSRAAQKHPQSAPPPISQPTRPNKDPEPHPPHLEVEPNDHYNLPDPDSQLLSQTNACPEASQPLLLYEEPPASQNTAPVCESAEQISQVPSVQDTSQTQNKQTNLNCNHNPASNPNDEAPTMTEDHLVRYLSSPTAERIAFLENWMSELIDDDSFMTLCEDVDGTWRRFAFGQRQ
ncbi:hypothetical protein DTO006G1_92 [Penicillium roqueforti]|uniref:uncharacterized protein n=1 Tax=Penicillium roqueforti TaxID=5082 RepID=UPI00190C91D0|nr:uncharacterized protein LCP9604111_6741 [Penicillium roqueforti]KAF9246069.1 hypothetical protein LCP9604111_6741 [Penicillium roqueforti]KAI1834455.1 hypothetical protein CBS147337_4745 [Penicillium roqueforti]KAI2686019.1 hypothetical protein CBS147355_1506 [Penicillium roqueforti]KAI2692234.1 hypothetical protein LCP963914a_328 [Penicillium roqueforti]KAI2717862.1 hypothetical protein CBS147318_4439 [Penicillium roqueforti]